LFLPYTSCSAVAVLSTDGHHQIIFLFRVGFDNVVVVRTEDNRKGMTTRLRFSAKSEIVLIVPCSCSAADAQRCRATTTPPVFAAAATAIPCHAPVPPLHHVTQKYQVQCIRRASLRRDLMDDLLPLPASHHLPSHKHGHGPWDESSAFFLYPHVCECDRLTDTTLYPSAFYLYSLSLPLPLPLPLSSIFFFCTRNLPG
jgi:hypothetical protein